MGRSNARDEWTKGGKKVHIETIAKISVLYKYVASKRRSPNLIPRGLKVLIVPKAGTSGLIYDWRVCMCAAEVEKKK